jgi:hypothetical protein
LILQYFRTIADHQNDVNPALGRGVRAELYGQLDLGILKPVKTTYVCSEEQQDEIKSLSGPAACLGQ